MHDSIFKISASFVKLWQAVQTKSPKDSTPLPVGVAISRRQKRTAVRFRLAKNKKRRFLIKQLFLHLRSEERNNPPKPKPRRPSSYEVYQVVLQSYQL